jgi:hypothetical protein
MDGELLNLKLSMLDAIKAGLDPDAAMTAYRILADDEYEEGY